MICSGLQNEALQKDSPSHVIQVYLIIEVATAAVYNEGKEV